jgi:hypothetical protein
MAPSARHWCGRESLVATNRENAIQTLRQRGPRIACRGIRNIEEGAASPRMIDASDQTGKPTGDAGRHQSPTSMQRAAWQQAVLLSNINEAYTVHAARTAPSPQTSEAQRVSECVHGEPTK